jgi:hypothetical protein
MQRPTITKVRMIWKGDHDSEKYNFFKNQYLIEINRLYNLIVEQQDAVSQDLDKCIDSDSSYPDNTFHPYQAEVSVGVPVSLNLNGTPMTFEDVNKINNRYNSAKEKAKFILRSLG